MKKIVSLSLVLTLLLGVLSGCANTAGGGNEASADVNLEEFYQTIFTNPENTPAMGPMEGEMLDAFYPGLSDVELKQTVAYMPMITAVACEIVMVEWSKEAQVVSNGNYVALFLVSGMTDQVVSNFNAAFAG